MKKDACMPDLTVGYYYPEIDSELDAKIEKCLEAAGFRRYASGYTYATKYRDLAFDRIENKPVD